MNKENQKGKEEIEKVPPQRSKKIFTIPNILSMVRIIMIPWFVWLYLNAKSTAGYWRAAGVILLSGLTDLADGYIARRFNMITELGKLLDPVADKLTQAAILICLAMRYKQIVVVFIILMARELFMGINGLILLRRGKKLDGAMWFGKVSTAVFYISTFVLIAFPNMSITGVNMLMVVVGFFITLSFLLYIPQYLRMYKESGEANTNKT